MFGVFHIIEYDDEKSTGKLMAAAARNKNGERPCRRRRLVIVGHE